jgi:hypothetical protein
MTTLFGSFGAKSLSGGRKLVRNIDGNPNSPRTSKFFFLNLYKVYNLCILMDFYLVLWRTFVQGPRSIVMNHLRGSTITSTVHLHELTVALAMCWSTHFLYQLLGRT